MSEAFRDRIVEFKRIPASKPKANPLNWRQHSAAQKAALQGILSEVGIAGALVARPLPDGDYELIDGHLRAETADQELPVLVLDVSEAEAKKLLAVYDPLSAMAEASTDKLAELLKDVQSGSEALQTLLSQQAVMAGIVPPLDAQEVWQGMPECVQEDQTGIREIRVHFRTEADVAAFQKAIGQTFSDKAKFIWYPEAEKDNVEHLRYVEGE